MSRAGGGKSSSHGLSSEQREEQIDRGIIAALKHIDTLYGYFPMNFQHP